MSSSSSLSAPHDVVPTRSRRLSPVRIEWADPLPTDCFAPAPAGCRCRDRAGRLRKRHEWDADGDCVWCGRGLPRMARRGR